jgi:integrase
MGYKLEDVAYVLKSFARYAERHGDEHVVTQTAVTWAEGASSQSRRHRRLQAVIRFARFMRVEDGRHEVPPGGTFAPSGVRRSPYVFSDEEIRLLIIESRHLRPVSSLRPHTYSTIFGLLAVTGLRVSEALRLKISDLTPDGLVIRNTKFRKDRLVPIHKTTAEALGEYMTRRGKGVFCDDTLFISNEGRRISYLATWETFHKVCQRAGIPRQCGAARVRLHDLRHTFAVRSLEAAPDSRRAVTSHMVALMTYLGHASLASTYWYLESTPELMADISNACQDFAKGVLS